MRNDDIAPVVVRSKYTFKLYKRVQMKHAPEANSELHWNRPEQYQAYSPYRIFLALHPLSGTESPEQEQFHRATAAAFKEKLQKGCPERLTRLHIDFTKGEQLSAEDEEWLAQFVAGLENQK